MISPQEPLTPKCDAQGPPPRRNRRECGMRIGTRPRLTKIRGSGWRRPESRRDGAQGLKAQAPGAQIERGEMSIKGWSTREVPGTRAVKARGRCVRKGRQQYGRIDTLRLLAQITRGFSGRDQGRHFSARYTTGLCRVRRNSRCSRVAARRMGATRTAVGERNVSRARHRLHARKEQARAQDRNTDDAAQHFSWVEYQKRDLRCDPIKTR